MPALVGAASTLAAPPASPHQAQQVMTLYGPECRPVTRQGLRFPRGWDNSCAIGVPSGVTQPLTASYPTPAT